MLVRELQQLLAQLYNIDVDADVIDFLVTDESFLKLLAGSLHLSPEENLILREADHGLDIALYLSEGLLRRVAVSDPCAELRVSNLDDFCKVLEGVSHFLYMAWSALNDRAVTRLQLEMQAEVDKYVCARLLVESQARPGIAANQLLRYLFDGVSYSADLSSHARERYRQANDSAGRYCRSLEVRFPNARVCRGMAHELRAFYRMPQPEKFSHMNAVQFI